MGTDYIKEYGKCQLGGIQLLSIIGEIEGHECVSENTKSTKYEHLLPILASVEDDEAVKGILFLVNTVGGDVSCGLALAEMIAGISKPTVSLIIGDSHSIGVPLAVATDHSFIVPSATMIIHPVRMSGMVIGAPQTYGQFQQIQDRIVDFIVRNCEAKKERIARSDESGKEKKKSSEKGTGGVSACQGDHPAGHHCFFHLVIVEFI